MPDNEAVPLNLEGLIESAKLSGRIDVLIELRRWLDAQLIEAEQRNEEMRSKD